MHLLDVQLQDRRHPLREQVKNASGTCSTGAAAICPNIVNSTAVISSCNGPNLHCGNAASAPKFSITSGRIRS